MRFKKGNIPANKSHGLRRHPLYDTYTSMMRRCYDKDADHYSDYGGRGITVCGEWRWGPTEFIEWAEQDMYWTPETHGHLYLDRRNNDGNYEPFNCRFITSSENNCNQRMSKYNTSGYAGVGWREAGQKWRARIQWQGHIYSVGRYKSKFEALQARNNMIKENEWPHKIQMWRG